VHSKPGIIPQGDQRRKRPQAKGIAKFKAMGEANEQERYLLRLKPPICFIYSPKSKSADSAFRIIVVIPSILNMILVFDTLNTNAYTKYH
jgi:hypothetical protein